jgi:hypothetical protein
LYQVGQLVFGHDNILPHHDAAGAGCRGVVGINLAGWTQAQSRQISCPFFSRASRLRW